MGSVWHETIRAWNVETLHHQKSLGQIGHGRCRKCQAETPYKEELEQVRHSSRRAYHAGKSGDWENHFEESLKNGKLSMCASV